MPNPLISHYSMLPCKAAPITRSVYLELNQHLKPVAILFRHPKISDFCVTKVLSMAGHSLAKLAFIQPFGLPRVEAEILSDLLPKPLAS